MRNTFDDEDGRFLVLCDVNGLGYGDGQEGRTALWPAFVPVPRGWWTLHGPAGRSACLARVAHTATTPSDEARR
ncbi:MbtH family NRPS accessory protein [Streptomyces sp. WAC06614]|uniref:MbtH family NRPS accessory protein n=1 Tax=Streptomyces sp. WAC06614 TaxID=2487416 RepID=UPI000F7802D9|nr:MbtH family NRPS accessory protein [Streptomyces sp. WAC06614]RSS74070.1 MbtH family protein [Streptomyces sp. WAC06614]